MILSRMIWKFGVQQTVPRGMCVILSRMIWKFANLIIGLPLKRQKECKNSWKKKFPWDM